MASKLLAAYGQRCAQPGSSLRKLAEAWASLISPLFDNGTKLSHAHHEVIEECLQTVFRNALQSDPTNAFWLRAAADYNYAKGELDEASILYTETLVACRSNLSAPFPDNVVDDTIWIRLRVCLSRTRHYMLSALVCQLIRNKKDEEYIKAYELLVSQQTLDAGSECSSMVFDHIMAEYISDAYEKNNQHACADRLV
uniref:TPR_REGION domain-containing protein n=1 Tax=Heterorhabditis bacteriophora TaxID=37862 RepID=A0A1I7XI44_HETBA